MSDEERASENPETPDASTDDVEVEDLEDAALDKYLDGKPDQESNPEENEGEETETVEEETSSPDSTETEDKPDSEGSELDSLKKQIEALSKQVSDKEEFIQNRNREIGDLRKQLREEAEQLREELPEIMAEDPVAGVDRVLRAREREAHVARMEADEAYKANKSEVLKFASDFEDRIDEVAEIAKSDGVPPEMIREFKNNPYATSPKLLKILLKRADEAKERVTLKEALQKEKAERESVAEKIAKAAAKTRVVSGKAPASASDDEDPFRGVTESDLESLSDEDLDALLEREG